MCGFLFYHSHDFSPVEFRQLGPALDSLRLRGPDELCAYAVDHEGVLHHCLNALEIESVVSCYTVTTLAVHARLAITGAAYSCSRQPFYDKSLNQIMLFNGEIYNFRELASSYFPLEPDAFASDTYLLSLLIRRFGSQAFDYVDGIYSVLTYNLDTRMLTAYRDPLGVKPLYYSFVNSQVVFGSNLKVCASLSKGSLKVDKSVASRYLKSGKLTSNNRTLLKGYNKVPAGFKLSSQLASFGTNYILQPWFSYNSLFTSEKLSPCSDDQSLISMSVRSQIPSGPFSILLSAGIDSSVVALESSKFSSHVINSYTGKSRITSDDESNLAASTASELNLRHKTIYPSADEFELLIDDYMSSTLSPLASFSHLLELSVYKLICKNGLKVVLAGHGADELFSGYTLVDPFLCFFSSLCLMRFNAAFKYLRNYAPAFFSPYSVAVYLKVMLSSYFSVAAHLFKYTNMRLSFRNKIRLLLSPLLCVRFNYLFLDSQLQSQLEPADLASMSCSIECRIPLVSLALIKKFFTAPPSSSGRLKEPLRSTLEKDKRTVFLAQPLLKKGFQFSYTPASHGKFSKPLSDLALRSICMEKFLKMIR